MIKCNKVLCIILFVGVVAYAMDVSDSLSTIREEMHDLHVGAVNKDIVLAGVSVRNLLKQRDVLKSITIQDIEGSSASSSELSLFMYSFFYDLVITGHAELLDIFLDMLYRSYPLMGINWLYMDSQGYFTLLDKAYRLRHALQSAGGSTENMGAVISVLVKHGAELYKNMISAQNSVNTQSAEQLQ